MRIVGVINLLYFFNTERFGESFSGIVVACWRAHFFSVRWCRPNSLLWADFQIEIPTHFFYYYYFCSPEYKYKHSRLHWFCVFLHRTTYRLVDGGVFSAAWKMHESCRCIQFSIYTLNYIFFLWADLLHINFSAIKLLTDTLSASKTAKRASWHT